MSFHSAMHTPHDKTYKLLYNFPYVVEAFLRAFGHYLHILDYILDVLNYGTLMREPADFLTKELKQRFCDRLWRLDPSAKGVAGLMPEMLRHLIATNGGTLWRPVYILLEFQSSIDKGMSRRIAEYVHLLHQDLIKRGELGLDDEPPLVIPIVIYIGLEPWTEALDQTLALMLSPVDLMVRTGGFLLFDTHAYRLDNGADLGIMPNLVRLEQATSAPEAARALQAIYEEIPGPEMYELRHAFHTRAILLYLESNADADALSFEELEQTFIGGTMSQVIETRLGRQIRNDQEQIRQEVTQQGIANERRLLRRQANSRFGAMTAEQFAGLIEYIDDTGHLEDIGDMIVRSRTGTELLRRVRESGQ